MTSVACTSNAYGQAARKKFVKEIRLSRTISIAFESYSSKLGLYYHPRLVRNGKAVKLKGYDETNGCDEDIKLSPNARYLTMSHIIKGYVLENNKRILHENYLCVIVDIKGARVVEDMQSDCGGEWNKSSQWISGDRIIFSGEGVKD